MVCRMARWRNYVPLESLSIFFTLLVTLKYPDTGCQKKLVEEFTL